jgi:hypothetical protein
VKTKRTCRERQGLLRDFWPPSSMLKIRAADAKEVGVGNPAEETCCYPNEFNVTLW